MCSSQRPTFLDANLDSTKMQAQLPQHVSTDLHVYEQHQARSSCPLGLEVIGSCGSSGQFYTPRCSIHETISFGSGAPSQLLIQYYMAYVQWASYNFFCEKRTLSPKLGPTLGAMFLMATLHTAYGEALIYCGR